MLKGLVLGVWVYGVARKIRVNIAKPLTYYTSALLASEMPESLDVPYNDLH